MEIEGNRLPNVWNDDAVIVEVHRCDSGVVIMLSEHGGKCRCGTKITYDEWKRLVVYVAKSFGDEAK